MSRKAKKRPPKCCKPDCFNCPYVDCRYDELETDDYTESNQRDYELYKESTGRNYHKGTDKDYRNKRQNAYNKENPRKRDQSSYLKQYYQEHREDILRKMKENYDTEKNTKNCRRWRKKNLEKRRKYDHERYLRRKEDGEFAKGRKESV